MSRGGAGLLGGRKRARLLAGLLGLRLAAQTAPGITATRLRPILAASLAHNHFIFHVNLPCLHPPSQGMVGLTVMGRHGR